MNWPLIGTYAKNIWTVVGPLAGVLIGAYIANRNQRKHWIADNKKEEYREMLAALNKAAMSCANVMLSEQDFRAWQNAHPETFMSVGEVIQTRIFTASTVKKLNLTDRFVEASPTQDETSGRKFVEAVEKLSDELQAAALKDIGI